VENLKSATHSYELLDFTAWWAPRQIKGLTFRAGVYNIFDEFYYPDALDAPSGAGGSAGPAKEYFSEPGRNYRMSATYKF
jgi:hemoglobin/transferrin/lactoferrin receptor protein